VSFEEEYMYDDDLDALHLSIHRIATARGLDAVSFRAGVFEVHT